MCVNVPLQEPGALTRKLVPVTSTTNRCHRRRSSRCVKLLASIHSILKQHSRTNRSSFVRWYRQISAICLWIIVGNIPPSIAVAGDRDVQFCPETGRSSSDIGGLLRGDGLTGRFGRFLALYFEELFHRCYRWACRVDPHLHQPLGA